MHDKKNEYNIIDWNLKQRYHLGYAGIYERIILKWILEEWIMKMWTALMGFWEYRVDHVSWKMIICNFHLIQKHPV
jgi:hypothetical protein